MPDTRHIRLTSEQVNELQDLLDNGDRPGMYMKYWEFTGSDQSILQA